MRINTANSQELRSAGFTPVHVVRPRKHTPLWANADYRHAHGARASVKDECVLCQLVTANGGVSCYSDLDVEREMYPEAFVQSGTVDEITRWAIENPLLE